MDLCHQQRQYKEEIYGVSERTVVLTEHQRWEDLISAAV